MKRLFALLLLGVFLINFSSALGWDNKIRYENNDMKAVIENVWGLPLIGEDLGTAELKSHKSVNHVLEVAPGKDKVVMYYDFKDFKELYKDGLEDPLFRNMTSGEYIEKDYKFVYWGNATKTVEDYDTRCEEVYNSTNKTATNVCENILIGTHEEQYETWIDYNSRDIPMENIRIGLQTDVNINDYIDGIWTIAGKKVSKHAEWTASLNVDISTYQNFELTNGSTQDSTNSFTYANNGATQGATGIINNAYDFESSEGDYVNIFESFDYTNTDFSISAWVKAESDTAAEANIFSNGLFATKGYGFYVDFSNSRGGAVAFVGYASSGDNARRVISNSVVGTGSWHHIVITRDFGTDIKLYLDGTEGTYESDEGDGTITSTDLNTSIGKYAGGASAYFDGIIDELGVWTRVLNQSEITQLYNDGSGITYTNQFLEVTLISPANNTNFTTNSVTFTANVIGTAQVDNVTLYIDGVANETNSSQINGTYTFDKVISDGSHNWSILAWDNQSLSTQSETRVFLVDTINPQINVESPTGTLDYNYIGGTETLNVTFTDTNLDSCWYNYNGTNISIDGCINGTKNSTQFILETGNTNMTIYANDTVDNENSTFISWEYKILEINQTFNNITTEGATEMFLINFTKSSTVQISTVYLYYNGTANSFPYSITGNNIISQSTITVPPVNLDTNITFYWNITLTDGTSIITNSNNQTIQIINIDNCSSFGNIIYNFTQYDEENQLQLGNNNTIELQINIYNTAKTTLLINFSQKYLNENPAQVCLEDPLLTTVNYSSYVVLKYFANITATNESYSIEYYNILNETITNTTVPKNIALYSLIEDDTTKFRLTFRDEAYTLAPNILVQVHRQYIEDNDFKIVEIPLTDSNGQTMLNLVKDDIIYNFIMVDENGDVVGTFNSVTAFCQDFTIGECTINLAPESISEDAYDYNEEFDISISESSYDNSTKTISINFVTGDLTPKTVKMDIVRNNDFGNRSVCSNTLTAASGTLSCNVSSVTDTDQFLFISTFVEDSLAEQDTINLNATTLNFGTLNGAFFAFLLILTLICLFMEEREILLVSLGIGWIIIIGLGLVNGKLIGFSSAGIWIIVSIATFLWKLNSEVGL